MGFRPKTKSSTTQLPAYKWDTSDSPVPAPAIKQQPTALVLAYNTDIVTELAAKLPTPVTHPPTEQQQVFLEALKQSSGNMVLSARAGTGKTSTIRMAVHALNQQAKARTVHSLGMGVWMKHNPGALVDKNKVRALLENYEEVTPSARPVLSRIGRSFITRLVDQAKQAAIGLLLKDEPQSYLEVIETYGLDMAHSDHYTNTGGISPDLDFAIHLAQQILHKSDAISDQVIDFNDQLRMPLIRDIPAKYWPHYDMVYVDEAQDISALRSMVIKKVAANNSNVVLVGDPYQAIYAFSGAMSNAIQRLTNDFNAVTYPLTVTHRCPKAIVRLANQWVPDYQAADSAPEGTITTIRQKDWKLSDLHPDNVILCRNNQPLMKLAFQLINNNIPLQFAGRDIGGMINAFLNKWANIRTNSALAAKLQEYEAKQTKLLLEKHKESQARELKERVELVLTVLDGCTDRGVKDVEGVRQFIAGLGFKDQRPGEIQTKLTLSSVHKSKGGEWGTVYLLGRNEYMPAKAVLASGIKEFIRQEDNLQYVAVTRTMNTLVEIDVPKERKQNKRRQKEIEYGEW